MYPGVAPGFSGAGRPKTGRESAISSLSRAASSAHALHRPSAAPERASSLAISSPEKGFLKALLHLLASLTASGARDFITLSP